jgi:hypothetical protein
MREVNKEQKVMFQRQKPEEHQIVQKKRRKRIVNINLERLRSEVMINPR